MNSIYFTGMLQSVRNKSRPDSTTFDNYDMGLGYNYSYSTRPSIDSVNMHSFLPLDLEGNYVFLIKTFYVCFFYLFWI